jgi:hypothetical protein
VGASLIGAAGVWVFPKLGRHHASRVALTLMCLTAQDGASRPLYYAGWQPIALWLGLSGTERTQIKRVSEILDHLVELGAIELVEPSAPGRNAKYLLHVRHELPNLRLVPPPAELDDPDSPVDNTLEITSVGPS